MKTRNFWSYTFKYLGAFLLGAFLLSLFSLFQKRLLGLPFSLAPKAFIIPILFGGISGLSLSIYYIRLRASRERMRDFINNVADIIQIIDQDGNFLFVNNAWKKTFGYSSQEIKNLNVFDLVHPDHLLDCQKVFQDIFEGEECNEKIDPVFISKEGNSVYLKGNISNRIEKGNVISTRGIFRDVTEEEKAEEFKRLTANILENTNEGVMIVDKQMRPVFVNKAFSKISGYSKREAESGSVHSVFPILDKDQRARKEVIESLATKGNWGGELSSRKNNGVGYALQISISAILNKREEITHYVGIFTDVSKRKEEKEQLYHVAMHDSLTNLPNREMFFELVTIASREAKEKNTSFAVLFIDLDNFKEVNDQYGHLAGDKFLELFAQRLRNNIRKTDTPARIGGDEFTVLLSNIWSEEDAKKIAEEIKASISNPFNLQKATVSVTASIGITLYTQDDEVSQLIKSADHAMYKAKKDGKNCIRFNLTRDTRPISEDVLP